jgi:retinol-binding protein 3
MPTRASCISLIAVNLCSVPLVSSSAETTPSPDPLAAERSVLVEAIATKVEGEYVYPDIGKAMADAIRARGKTGEYDSISNGQQLAERLTTDLRAVSHDKHLRVDYRAEGAPDYSKEPSPEEIKTWREEAGKKNFGFNKVERMDGNIGYIQFDNFPPPDMAGQAANAAMTFIANTDALILDLRKNHGGTPEMVAYLASYFFDQRTRLNDIYIRRGDRLEQFWTASVPGPLFGIKKPVYILTSHETFSAAEDFTYAMKNLKRAKIVGEVTGGGAHPTEPFKVTEHFTVGVPNARSISTITHTDWEGSGVTPDVAVDPDGALKAAYSDALQSLIANTDDPKRKDELRKLLSR